MSLTYKNKRIAIGLFFSVIITSILWTCWNQLNFDSTSDISIEYENLINLIHTKSKSQSLISAQKFISDHKNVYGSFISLELAKLFIENHDFQNSIFYLQKGVDLDIDNKLKNIISLRLARIYIENKKVEEAIKILNSIKETSFFSIKYDLLGDALFDKGDKKGAFLSWKEGINSKDIPLFLKEKIEMKMNNLSYKDRS